MRPARRIVILAALAFHAAGCAPALSTLHPATIAPYRHADGGIGYGVSVPVAGIGRSVGATKKIVARTEEGEPLSDADRDEVLRTSLGLALNPPGFGSQYRLAYGIAPDLELDLRYALSAWRLGARYQMIRPREPGALAGSLGLGVSRYTLGLGVPRFVEPIVDEDELTRWDVDVPVLFGVSHEWVHLWAGPKLVASFMRAGYSVCVQVDTTSKSCSERAEASFEGRALYAAGQAGAALGYRHVWVALELTAAYAGVDVSGRIRTASVDERRRYRFGDVIVYPVVGVIVRF